MRTPAKMSRPGLRFVIAVEQTKGVKVDVKTMDGKKMTPQAATEPVGSALRIAPGFTATMVDDDAGIETTLEAVEVPARIRTTCASALRRIHLATGGNSG